MTSDDKPRRVEVRDGDQTVAATEVAEHAEGTIRTSLLPFGDAGSLELLRERTEDTVTRPAGVDRPRGCGHTGHRRRGPRRGGLRRVISLPAA